jgi:hypothetical protein
MLLAVWQALPALAQLLILWRDLPHFFAHRTLLPLAMRATVALILAATGAEGESRLGVGSGDAADDIGLVVAQADYFAESADESQPLLSSHGG